MKPDKRNYMKAIFAVTELIRHSSPGLYLNLSETPQEFDYLTPGMNKINCEEYLSSLIVQFMEYEKSISTRR